MKEVKDIYLFNLYHIAYSSGWNALLNFNYKERHLRYSDYGITELEVEQYVNELEKRMEYVYTQATFIRRRFDLMKTVFVILLIIVGFMFSYDIIALSNDYLNGLILVYILLATLCGKGFVFMVECTKKAMIQKLENPYYNPPDYDARIWKYFIDLYWIKTSKDIEKHNRIWSAYINKQRLNE